MVLTVMAFSLYSGMTALAAPETMADGSIFDAEYYAQNNPDVTAMYGTDKEALFFHYVTYGKAEGRLAYGDDTVIYLEKLIKHVFRFAFSEE